MTLLHSFALMGIGIVLLLAGAEALVRGSAALALRFGAELVDVRRAQGVVGRDASGSRRSLSG